MYILHLLSVIRKHSNLLWKGNVG